MNRSPFVLASLAAVAPAAVLRDLEIHGLIDDSGRTVNCGKA